MEVLLEIVFTDLAGSKYDPPDRGTIRKLL
jgi:hypothetical protein